MGIIISYKLVFLILKGEKIGLFWGLLAGNEKIVESIILNGCVASLVDIFDKQ